MHALFEPRLAIVPGRRIGYVLRSSVARLRLRRLEFADRAEEFEQTRSSSYGTWQASTRLTTAPT